jgi:hypothetical protein
VCILITLEVKGATKNNKTGEVEKEKNKTFKRKPSKPIPPSLPFGFLRCHRALSMICRNGGGSEQRPFRSQTGKFT